MTEGHWNEDVWLKFDRATLHIGGFQDFQEGARLMITADKTDKLDPEIYSIDGVQLQELGKVSTIELSNKDLLDPLSTYMLSARLVPKISRFTSKNSSWTAHHDDCVV